MKEKFTYRAEFWESPNTDIANLQYRSYALDTDDPEKALFAILADTKQRQPSWRIKNFAGPQGTVLVDA